MHRFFVRSSFADDMAIVGKDAYHISKVLRMQIKDKVQIVSLDQISALMEITAITSEEVKIHLVEKLPFVNEPKVKIILAQGLAKGDKFDFIMQKAVEIGVSEIIPVAMDNCVVQLDKGKAKKKVERWQKIVEEAAKQSKRDIIPRVEEVLTFEELLEKVKLAELKILAYEVEDKKGLKTLLKEHADVKEIVLLIGPEGGISKEEYTKATANGFASVSLGNRILRTETAGLATVAAILYETGDFGGL